MAKAASNSFRIHPEDPLREAHLLLQPWMARADLARFYLHCYTNADLKSDPSGQALSAAPPDQARRLVVAAAEQARHYGPKMWPKEQQAAAVIHALLRRSLPLDQADCLILARYAADSAAANPYRTPVKVIIQSIARVVADDPVDDELRTELDRLAGTLLSQHAKKFRDLGGEAQRIANRPVPTPDADLATETASSAPRTLPPVVASRPAPAGDPRVLVPLKRYLGIPLGGDAPSSPVGESTRIGPDRFELAPDSPLATEHGWLSEALKTMQRTHPSQTRHPLSATKSGAFLSDLDPPALGRVMLAAAERQVSPLLGSQSISDEHHYRAQEVACELFDRLANLSFTLDRAGTIDFLLFLGLHHKYLAARDGAVCRDQIARFEAFAEEQPPTAGERFTLALLRATVAGHPPLGRDLEHLQALTRLIGDGVKPFLAPGEHWTDAANADLSAEPPSRRAAWAALLEHTLKATAARPAARWLAEARKLIEVLDGETIGPALGRWFGLVTRGRIVPVIRDNYYRNQSGDLMVEGNAAALKGLLWLVPSLPHPETLIRAIGSVAQSAYRKAPGIGPRAVKVGNAAVASLAAIGSPGAVGQLALLKVKVKFGTAQKEIGKAFDAAAQALGLPRDEIEELGVPSYGLEEVGRRVDELGDSRAELVVTGTDVALRWSDAKGKTLKSAPAAAKRDHKDELKELQDAVKDIGAMLPAQRDRIDGLFLLRRSWPVDAWRERYADHPLVGTIARRLIWRVDGRAALFHDGTPTDVAGEPVAVGESSRITLWHPVESPTSEVLAWRRRLEGLDITQPFKQAHREVYLLTDAERRTATYSNRFAAHVVRQHQLNALAAARGWRSALRVHDDYSQDPTIKALPAWDLRVEYWVEGICHDWGTDRNDAGAYLRLATDQVRFYPPDAGGEPLPLEQVPPLVFSEVMRDVDLFVGVASVGNDPTWQDGGPGGHHRDYWQGYSFGELSGTATTRRDVLERLVPRLKIAKRCSFTDRFLRVQGERRAYKIHLGSGNILMEPNDQYLCIVPDASARARGTGDIYLPFEGDSMLSVILSKAFLLADDSKITDRTITRQIDGP